jgi:valacyclovir hydrolase
MPYFNWENHRIHYREQGKGDLLLILPGNTASSTCHQGELDHFGNRFRTVSMDFLGTGRSDHVHEWSDDWWLQGARQAKALSDHLGYEKCTVMGTSGGAASALLMAIHFAGSVDAVIADSCVEFFSLAFTEQNVLPDRKRRTTGQIEFWKYANGDDWEQVVDADTAMLLRFAKQGGDWFSGRLGEIHCPVLLTASKKDRDLPQIIEQNGRMAEQIPSCRLFINDRGSHPLMWSAPQDFRAAADDFLISLQSR